MFVCKMNQSVKYVQFKGAPVELIDGYKYTNKELIDMYPDYFIEIKETPKSVVQKEQVLTEVVETKKRGRPAKVLIDDSSDVTIKASED